MVRHPFSNLAAGGQPTPEALQALRGRGFRKTLDAAEAAGRAAGLQSPAMLAAARRLLGGPPVLPQPVQPPQEPPARP